MTFRVCRCGADELDHADISGLAAWERELLGVLRKDHVASIQHKFKSSGTGSTCGERYADRNGRNRTCKRPKRHEAHGVKKHGGLTGEYLW